jgi:hypothetical protein
MRGAVPVPAVSTVAAPPAAVPAASLPAVSRAPTVPAVPYRWRSAYASPDE